MNSKRKNKYNVLLDLIDEWLHEEGDYDEKMWSDIEDYLLKKDSPEFNSSYGKDAIKKNIY